MLAEEMEPGEFSEDEEVEIIDNIGWDGFYGNGAIEALHQELRRMDAEYAQDALLEAEKDKELALSLGI